MEETKTLLIWSDSNGQRVFLLPESAMGLLNDDPRNLVGKFMNEHMEMANENLLYRVLGLIATCEGEAMFHDYDKTPPTSSLLVEKENVGAWCKHELPLYSPLLLQGKTQVVICGIRE